MNSFRKHFYAIVLSLFIFFPGCEATIPNDNPNPDKTLSDIRIPDKTGMNLKGCVIDSLNQPISGVVVNDGTNFTTTDEKGIYYLPTDLAKNKYVRISVPAEYTIPNTSGIASGFYAKLTYGKEVNQRDFVLKKRTTPVTEFVYIAISDPQVKNAAQLERFRNETVTDIKNYIKGLSGKETYGMALGDMVYDVMDLFPLYKSAVSSMGLTMFHTIGNHDFNLTYNSLHNTVNPLDNYGEQNYESFFGPTDYSFNIGNVHIISMNDIDYLKNKNYTERFTEDQLEWLKKDLAYVKAGSLIFLNIHAPTSNKTGQGSSNLKNTAQLMDILKDYHVHIFAGHTHFYENTEINASVYEHNIGAACGAWWAGNVNRCGAPNGYLVVNVNQYDVKWHYKATGHDKDYQFRVYKPGEFKSQPEYLVVNIWDWDSKFNVNWYEDGQLKGAMQKFEDEDQDFINMTGTPKGYHTQHLFRVIPSSKNIKVEISNRFGEVYSQTLSL